MKGLLLLWMGHRLGRDRQVAWTWGRMLERTWGRMLERTVVVWEARHGSQG